MKVISIREPYATLIMSGVKTIETRSWSTKYRGKLYIHASMTNILKSDRDNVELMKFVDFNNLNFGKIICSCELVDCVFMTDEFIESIKNNDKNNYITGIYEVGRYAWILKDIKVLDSFISAKGKLGIWNYENSKE